jgi:endonuclease III-like uncharacterized protein
VESRWESDQRVLAAVVELYEKDGHHVRRSEVHAAVDDLDQNAVDQSLRRLSDASYILGRGTGQAAVVAIVGVTEKGLRASGFWPSKDEAFERMLRTLEEEVEREPDPEKKSKRRAFLEGMRGLGREVAVEIISTAVKAGVGL